MEGKKATLTDFDACRNCFEKKKQPCIDKCYIQNIKLFRISNQRATRVSIFFYSYKFASILEEYSKQMSEIIETNGRQKECARDRARERVNEKEKNDIFYSI